MKFNWGHAIVLVLTLFGVLIGTMVYKSMQQNIDLVTEDYYNTEVSYQETQLRKEKAAVLGSIQVKKENEQWLVILPETVPANQIGEGEIRFYNPRLKKLDFTQKIKPGQHVQIVNQQNIAGGKWTVSVDIPGEMGLYFELNVYL